MSDAPANPNDEAIEAWNTVLFDKWLRFRDIVTTGLGSHGEVTLARLGVGPGMRVLDVGCGLGDTTQRIAALVGPGGKATGVDAAPRFIERAKREAETAGIRNASFIVADVQADDLGGPYDVAFSRMGTMFFANPVQAMRCVRRALSDDGRLGMTVWRKREENAFVNLAERVVEAIIPKPETHDAPTCGPGPFSMSSPDVVSDILQRAGFRQVTFERNDAPIKIGRDIDEAVEFAMALGPAGELIRLAGEAGERRRPEVVAALARAYAELSTPDGVLAPSSTWIVTARAG